MQTTVIVMLLYSIALTFQYRNPKIMGQSKKKKFIKKKEKKRKRHVGQTYLKHTK